VTDTPAVPRVRNYAVDFFRGCALLIIFISHTQGNPWYWFMPTRIGFADAAELFVFCSGVVVAYAYGKTFARAGFGLGVAKTAKRCLELYAVHIMLVILFLFLVENAQRITGINYEKSTGLDFFISNPGDAINQLLSLTYVPNFLDILPLYFSLLAILPIMVLLGRIHPMLMLGTSLAIYILAWIFDWHFIAQIQQGRPWFFNPFGWQLLFYIGYAIGAGWFPYPKNSKPLLLACIAFFIIAIPLTYFPLHWQFPILGKWFGVLQPVMQKTQCGPLRIIYFLAMAYIARWWAIRHPEFFSQGIAKWITLAGQQSLTVFACGTLFSFVAGVIIAQLNRDSLLSSLVNIAGCVLLIAIAYVVSWFKAKPWQPSTRNKEGA
jgi:hypothetical protein